MPVTARLSRKFYEALGDDIANELVDWFNQVDATYRAELRELNELNFARFEASMKHRMAELATRLERRITQVATEFEKRVSALESKVEARFAEQAASFETRFAEQATSFETRFAEQAAYMGARFAEQAAKIDAQLAEHSAANEHRYTNLRVYVDQRLSEMEQLINGTRADLIKWMFAFWIGTLAPLAGLIVLLTR